MYSLIICHKDRCWRYGARVRLMRGMVRRKHFIGSEPFASANIVSMFKVFDPARATFKFVGGYLERFGD
jgi:hypothetical protein